MHPGWITHIVILLLRIIDSVAAINKIKEVRVIALRKKDEEIQKKDDTNER